VKRSPLGEVWVCPADIDLWMVPQERGGFRNMTIHCGITQSLFNGDGHSQVQRRSKSKLKEGKGKKEEKLKINLKI